jgi:hypothetical protein
MAISSHRDAVDRNGWRLCQGFTAWRALPLRCNRIVVV